MNKTFDNNKRYKIIQKDYNNFKFRELFPILTDEERKEQTEQITQMCIQIIREHKKIKV